MINEAIVLAGGLGTRLRSAVPDLPKCMAPVAGHPFLTHVIRHLLSKGITRFIFSLGYRHDEIEFFLSNRFQFLNYKVVVEKEPLGTGGAIQAAMQECETENVLVVNGDTLFEFDLASLEGKHHTENATCTLVLKTMENFDRYGVVETNDTGRVIRFSEKKHYVSGNINGGVYLIRKAGFLKNQFPETFSFEKDYLEKFLATERIFGQVQEGYFIDIGIPSDFGKARHDLQPAPPPLSGLDKNWTLFLDRDGVINYDKDGSYIFHTGEFRLYNGVPAAIAACNNIFGRVCVVTNQRGVEKGLMTENDLRSIHQEMTAAFAEAGGRLDAIYYCTSLSDRHPERKPNPGMALLAKKQFPDIDLSKSLMVGNKLSDMQFGRNAGMKTVYIATTHPDVAFPHPDIDYRFDLLTDFVKALRSSS